MAEISNTPWTLESELCRLAQESDIRVALCSLGLLSGPGAKFRLVEQSEKWDRGGAETYLYRFRIEEDDKDFVEVLIKACVAFAPGGTLNEILKSWVERRQILEKHGVSVPKLYYWGQGVVLEEFIPYTLRDVLSRGAEPSQTILNDLTKFAAALSSLGFAPIGPFSDLRSRGDDVVVVDFGQDLGPPNVRMPTPAVFSELNSYLNSSGLSVSSQVWDELREVFAAHGGELLH